MSAGTGSELQKISSLENCDIFATPSFTVQVHVQSITEANWRARKGIGPQGTLVGEFKIPGTATTADFLAELEKLAGPKDGGDDGVAWHINFVISKKHINFKFKGFGTDEGLEQVVSEYMGMKNKPETPVYLTLKKDLREAKKPQAAAEQAVGDAPESGSWFLQCCGLQRNDGTSVTVPTAAAKAKEDAAAAAHRAALMATACQCVSPT